MSDQHQGIGEGRGCVPSSMESEAKGNSWDKTTKEESFLYMYILVYINVGYSQLGQSHFPPPPPMHLLLSKWNFGMWS